jgi:hypothetical protein
MLLPGGRVVAVRDGALSSMSGPSWQSYRLENVTSREVITDTVLVTYGAVAARDGKPPCSA